MGYFHNYIKYSINLFDGGTEDFLYGQRLLSRPEEDDPEDDIGHRSCNNSHGRQKDRDEANPTHNGNIAKWF